MVGGERPELSASLGLGLDTSNQCLEDADLGCVELATQGEVQRAVSRGWG